MSTLPENISEGDQDHIDAHETLHAKYNEGLVTDADLDAHEGATSDVHGVGTSEVESTDGAQAKADGAVSDHESATDPHSQYAQSGDLADVATSGSYGDLSNRSHGNEDHDEDFLAEGDANATYQPNDLYIERSGKDAEGIFTVVETFRTDTGTRYSRSELSGGSSPEYAQRTVTWYEDDGTTERDSVTYDLTFDGDGDLTSEAVAA